MIHTQTFQIGNAIQIDATTDSRLAARTHGCKGIIVGHNNHESSFEYQVKLKNNPFILSFSKTDLIPA